MRFGGNAPRQRHGAGSSERQLLAAAHENQALPEQILEIGGIELQAEGNALALATGVGEGPLQTGVGEHGLPELPAVLPWAGFERLKRGRVECDERAEGTRAIERHFHRIHLGGLRSGWPEPEEECGAGR